jgi:hypothetical protein
MPPEDTSKTSPTAPIPPIPVTVVGTATRGGGAPLTTGTTATTPDQQPNLAITVIKPIVAIGVRFLNGYLTMLVGLVSAGMATNIIPAAGFVSLVAACAKLSFAGAGLGALKDCVTIFGRLEGKFPLATGSV